MRKIEHVGAIQAWFSVMAGLDPAIEAGDWIIIKQA
jgi:hypothetical protein